MQRTCSQINKTAGKSRRRLTSDASLVSAEILHTSLPAIMSLNNIVSPLVDSLSLLVLECVGGSLKDVTTHCMTLASNTQALVDQAQKVALATDDNEVVSEIINSINIIADQIGELVGSFQALIQNRTDPTLVKNFSTTAQNVADAISGLVNATDETSQKRLIGLVRYDAHI